jgi:integrase
MTFQEFLETLRNDETRRTYKSNIMLVTGDADALLGLEQKAIEEKVISWIVKNRNKKSSAYINTCVLAVKSFLEYHEKFLNWRRIRLAMPAARKYAADRPPTREEIARLLQIASLRLRVPILFMASSGIRIGAFGYLRVSDLEKLPSGIGKLTVYRGEPEQYFTFVSREAMAAYEAYIEQRRNAGENIAEKSPLIRDAWCNEIGRRYMLKTKEEARMINPKSLANRIEKLWVNAGIIQRGGEERKRHEFQRVHGFRKFFRSNAVRGMRSEDVEVLLGHKSSYYKPNEEYLENEYLKAEPYLFIDEALTLKSRGIVLPDEIQKMRSEIEELKRKLVWVAEHGIKSEP